MSLPPSAIRGFNYQPSYGSNGLELWQRFDAAAIRREIERGRRYFPGMNAIRFWLSWDAYSRDPDGFCRNFQTALEIFAEQDLVVMPVLFNRWHNTLLDYGGVYLDHFLGYMEGVVSRKELFDDYVRRIVREHSDDPRIFCWDLCNEPNPVFHMPNLAKLELDWLARMYAVAKDAGARAPITVGSHLGCHVSHVEPFSDWLSIHPYLMEDTPENRARFSAMLDDYVEVARKAGKPLLATETCWGSLSDEARVANIRFTLGELKTRNIGWLAYLLHHSLVADAHRPEFGPVGYPGNLAFIEADGSLRPGHECFNEF